MPKICLCHVGVRSETVGQKLGKGNGFVAVVFVHKVDKKRVITKFPHHLTADTARGELSRNHTVFSSADRNGGKGSVAVIDGFEKGGTFGAVRWAVGGIFDITALIDRAVCA